MNSTKRGWLKNYIDLRHGLLQNLKSPLFQTSHPDHTLYRAIQPTGLMYGQTVSVEKESLLPANRKVQTKIALAESLISSSILSQDKPIDSAEAFDVAVEKAIEDIGSFYNNVFPEIATPSKTLFGRKRTAYEMAESVLEKRVQLTGEIQGNFWTNFFQRSMLFLDVFIFGQWIHTNADKIVTDFFRYERDELRFSIVKVISAAAHANREVAYQEKKLFEFFIYSTNLPPAKRKEAMAIFEQGIAIDDINLPADNSWILKKFFLEIAILTLWVDKRLEQQELDFIKCFTHYLNFSEQELEHSLMAIEGFVLEHWQEIEYLQRNQNYQQICDQYIFRLSLFTSRNKNKLLKDIRDNSSLLALLEKAKRDELSSLEKEDIRMELIHILKNTPSFLIIALPESFLTLPVLLKILPSELFRQV